jgi:polyphenol oxidase
MTMDHDLGPTLSECPGVRHAFLGRRGGVSTGDFASLNVSETSGDDLNHVARNRAQAVEAISFPASALATLKQVHSTTVIALTDPPNPDTRPEGDAIVTATPGLVLGILTADCAPVLLADPEARVIGAFHAGWKGAIGGIARNTVEAMVALGANPANIVAAIGPTISAANYEVGPDFAADLVSRHPAAGSRLSKPGGGREHFDLPGFVLDQLRDAGVGLVEDLAICTYAHPERHFSHRYATHNGTTTGRQIALIGLD